MDAVTKDEVQESTPGEGYKWREDVLLRVMSQSGIDESLRDEFVRHAVNYDIDDNMYLKKAEIESAAEAWVLENSEGESESEDTTNEIEAADEVAEEPVEESEAADAEAEDTTEETSNDDAEVTDGDLTEDAPAEEESISEEAKKN